MVVVVLVLVVAAGPEEHLPVPPPGHGPLVTDRLLDKIEKQQTNFDVQIGDGMDIGIIGENGRSKIINRVTS